MGVTNLRGTQARLRRLAKLPEDAIERTMRGMILEGVAGVIDTTPRDRGRLLAGWDVTLNAPSTRIPPPRSKNARPRERDPETMSAAALTGIASSPFAIVYITNNTPYAEVIELGLFQPSDPGPSKDRRAGRTGRTLVAGGFSTQAPRGMLRGGLLRIAAFVRDASGGLPR